jgi:hypothetical protein
MKCQWDRHKIQQVDAPDTGFSELQAFRIRSTLEKAGSNAASTCTTAADAYHREPDGTSKDPDARPR